MNYRIELSYSIIHFLWLQFSVFSILLCSLSKFHIILICKKRLTLSLHTIICTWTHVHLLCINLHMKTHTSYMYLCNLSRLFVTDSTDLNQVGTWLQNLTSRKLLECFLDELHPFVRLSQDQIMVRDNLSRAFQIFRSDV